MRDAVPLITRSNSSVRFDTRPRQIQGMANTREALGFLHGFRRNRARLGDHRVPHCTKLPCLPWPSTGDVDLQRRRLVRLQYRRTNGESPSPFARSWKTVLQGIVFGTMAKQCRRCHRHERSGSVLRGMSSRLFSGPGCRTRLLTLSVRAVAIMVLAYFRIC
jgi:hypothetical protein